MAGRKRLNRTMENVIGFLALAAVSGAVLAILNVQKDSSLQRYGVVISSEPLEQSENSFFSVSDEFEVLSRAEHYDSDTLYEKINGKAPLYTDAGFEKLDTQRYTLKSNSQLWIEICRYNMSSPQAAFYVYSTQKRSSGTPIEGISAEHGYKTTSGVYLAAGSNYFEISASAEDDTILRALSDCLSDIAALEKQENAYMPLPEFLPEQYAVAASIKMYLNGAFGIENLGKVYMRQYDYKGEKFNVFAIADAKSAMAAFEAFMNENGGEIVDKGDGIITYDLFGVYEIMTVAGDYLTGIHEADDPAIGREFVKMMTKEFGKD